MRAVGLVVGLVERGMLRWPEFQGELIETISAWERANNDARSPWSYYSRWEQALARLVVGKSVVSEQEVQERTEEFLSGQRTPPHTHGGGLLACFPAETASS